MGDMADYYRDQEDVFGDCMDESSKIPVKNKLELYNNKSLFWETKEGEEILIQDMSNLHLENSIKYVERTDPNNKELFILKLDLKRRLKTL
jgi:hypothetical protein